MLYSVGANAMHGLRRTNEDKRSAVMTLLSDEEWSKWSDREIARRCAVSNQLVSNLRPSVNGGQMDAPRTVQRGGKVYEQNVTRIGKAAKPSEPARPEAGDPPPNNIIPLGDRLVPVVSERAVEREAEAAEAADRAQSIEEYDETNIEHRARAINGALNTFDFVPITGAEFWQVYGREPTNATHH